MNRLGFACWCLLLVQNAATILGAIAESRVHGRRYTMTGPEQWHSIETMNLLSFGCSVLALILGLLVLAGLRFLGRGALDDVPDDVVFFRRWAYVSLLFALLVFVIGLVPTYHG